MKNEEKDELRKRTRNIGLVGLVAGFSVGIGAGICSSYLILNPDELSKILNSIAYGSFAIGSGASSGTVPLYRDFKDYLFS